MLSDEKVQVLLDALTGDAEDEQKIATFENSPMAKLLRQAVVAAKERREQRVGEVLAETMDEVLVRIKARKDDLRGDLRAAKRQMAHCKSALDGLDAEFESFRSGANLTALLVTLGMISQEQITRLTPDTDED